MLRAGGADRLPLSGFYVRFLEESESLQDFFLAVPGEGLGREREKGCVLRRKNKNIFLLIVFCFVH